MTIFQIFNSRIQKHGSFEDFMIELAGRCRTKGIRLSFAFPRVESEDVKKGLLSLDARIHTIEPRWSSLYFVKEVLNIVRKESPYVLDFHFCSSLNLVILFLILRILGKKVIFHYHGEIRPVEELSFINRHFSKLRLVTLFANKIICVSEANKRFLKALNIRKKIYVIYNGINIDNFTNIRVERDFRKEAGFNNGELIVTSIGSLIPRKGIGILIKAAKNVIDEIPQARFVIIGGGDMDKYLKLTEDLGIKDRVMLTGLLKEYPYHILKASDLYVSASFAESFGLSIAEAQILGIPVVATKVGGVPEVVNDGKTGVLVNPRDIDNLAKEITRLLTDKKLRREFSDAGRIWVKQRFNLTEKVEELLNVCSN